MNSRDIHAFLEDASVSVDISRIEDYWAALGSGYDVGSWLLPLPPWRQQPYTDSGSDAWHIVQRRLFEADPHQPISIYLHIPFCASKCGFCDSYSFKLGSYQQERIQQYVDRLCYELCLWSEQGNLRERPVSTVHLGGGTPTFIGEAALTQIVECCKANFSITPSTEWALESTASALSPSMIETMHDLGFRRLHIGVQSMENDVRAVIGRRTPASVIQEKIQAGLAHDWVVSVDLICGLPHQTLSGVVAGIEDLIDRHIDGFSLYELLIYPQNRRWVDRHGLNTPDRHLPNYLMFLAGAAVLEARGYHKNLFNHWANERDKNIYFTFPMRGEDLIAVGALADGVIGDYHYRHLGYANYLKDTEQLVSMGFEGGLQRDPQFNQIQPLVKALQSAHIPLELVPAFESLTTTDGTRLLDRWLACKLVEIEASGALELTISGSWFTGNLIRESATAWMQSSHRIW